MWLLHFLPDGFLNFVVNSILVVGFISTILTLFVINRLLIWFPAIAGYYRLIQAVSVAVFLLGVYLKGSYSTEMQWRERVAELQARVAQAEAQSTTANTVVQEKIVEKTKVVRERGRDIVKYVDREVVKKEEIIKYIEQCPVPKEIIDLHNAATELNRAAEGKR
jgi:membrane protein implicated in regulation of membrane protease activity